MDSSLPINYVSFISRFLISLIVIVNIIGLFFPYWYGFQQEDLRLITVAYFLVTKSLFIQVWPVKVLNNDVRPTKKFT